jgi:predicted Zn-dependent protease
MHLSLRDATAHALRGSAALGLGKNELAERELKLAVSLDGSQPTWRAEQIRALVKLKKTADAQTALDDLTKQSPDFAGLDELRQLLKEQQP